MSVIDLNKREKAINGRPRSFSIKYLTGFLIGFALFAFVAYQSIVFYQIYGKVSEFASSSVDCATDYTFGAGGFAICRSEPAWSDDLGWVITSDSANDAFYVLPSNTRAESKLGASYAIYCQFWSGDVMDGKLPNGRKPNPPPKKILPSMRSESRL